MMMHGLFLYGWQFEANEAEQPMVVLAVQLSMLQEPSNKERVDPIRPQVSPTKIVKDVPQENLKTKSKIADLSLDPIQQNEPTVQETAQEIERDELDIADLALDPVQRSEPTVQEIERDELDDEKIKAHVIAHLYKELAQYFTYPHIARRKGWQGKVLLDLNIAANGYINNIKLVKSSGYRILDRSAMEILGKIGRVDTINTRSKGSPLDVRIPIIYHLEKG